MENLPTLAIRQAQKGLVPGYAANSCVVCTRMESGVKHQPKVTPNGHTERGNPSRALSAMREQATRPQAVTE
jgi:hypothetical protein